MGGRSAGCEASAKHASNCCGNEGRPPCCSVLWKDYANMLRTNYTQKQGMPNRQRKLMGKLCWKINVEFAELAKGSLYKVSLYTAYLSIFWRFATLSKLLTACHIESLSYFSLSSTMNPFENALFQVVDHMLNEKKCCVKNSLVRDKLTMMLRMRKSACT